MTVAAITSATSANSTATQNIQTAYQKGGIDFKSLLQALQSGNLSSAQQAYSALQQDVPGISGSQTTSPTSTSSAASQISPLSTDFQNLGQALQSGDLTAAQNALAQLQQDALQIGGGHHHHHHHHAGAQMASSSTDAASYVTGTTTAAGSINVAA